jgi:hypothetical protein
MATSNEGTCKAKGMKRCVHINPIPQVHIIDSTGIGRNVSSKHDTNHQNVDKIFYLFYANVSSLSPQAQDYLFSLPEEVKALALLELHKQPDVVSSAFECKNFSMTYNPPEDTMLGGTHGGELIAVKSHIESKTIDQHVLDSIAEHFDSKLR